MRTLLLLGLLVGCSSDPGNAPNATFKAVTPDELVASDDALDDATITIEYDDGDGDLGEGTAEVHDCRAEDIVTALPIPQIAAKAGDHISGTLDLHVNDIGFIALGAQPQTCADLGVPSLAPNETIFCVVLVDKAGHRGDGDCTTAVTLDE